MIFKNSEAQLSPGIVGNGGITTSLLHKRYSNCSLSFDRTFYIYALFSFLKYLMFLKWSSSCHFMTKEKYGRIKITWDRLVFLWSIYLKWAAPTWQTLEYLFYNGFWIFWPTYMFAFVTWQRNGVWSSLCVLPSKLYMPLLMSAV